MPFAPASGRKARRKPAPSRRVLLQQWGRVVLIFGCFATRDISGCSKSSSSSRAVAMQCEISPQPARVGPTTVTLRLADGAARQITRARVVLEADMTHPGMSPVFGETKEVDPGRYQGRIDFTMAGDWVILLHITLADGQNLKRQVDVKGVQAN
jgi:YtkA-like